MPLHTSSWCHCRLRPVIVTLHTPSWWNRLAVSCDCGSPLILLVPLAALHVSSCSHWLAMSCIIALHTSSWRNRLVISCDCGSPLISWHPWPAMSCDSGSLLILLAPLNGYFMQLWVSTHPVCAIGRLCPVIMTLHSSSWHHTAGKWHQVGRICLVIVDFHASSWCQWPAMSCVSGSPRVLLVPLAG